MARPRLISGSTIDGFVIERFGRGRITRTMHRDCRAQSRSGLFSGRPNGLTGRPNFPAPYPCLPCLDPNQPPMGDNVLSDNMEIIAPHSLGHWLRAKIRGHNSRLDRSISTRAARTSLLYRVTRAPCAPTSFVVLAESSCAAEKMFF
jgi:hypothetical protein